MHLGFWDKNTKDRQQAVLNENQAIIDLAKVRRGQKVLDAGCGVGGTAIYIAKKTAAFVVGITLSQKQVYLAKKNAKRHKVDKLTQFFCQDYSKTNFDNNTFDVVYGIESICHAYPKSKFLAEAYPILKPRGKLVVADGYTSRLPKTIKEKEIIKKFTWAFALKEIIPKAEMTSAISDTGFVNVKETGKTNSILPSVNYFSYAGVTLFPMVKILSFLPIKLLKTVYRNNVAAVSLYEGIKKGLAAYYLHYAEKPRV